MRRIELDLSALRVETFEPFAPRLSAGVLTEHDCPHTEQPDCGGGSNGPTDELTCPGACAALL